MAQTLVALTMPKFGLAMTEGKLASWTVDVGQATKQGDELADIETSKITSGYESPAAGVLRRQVAQAGETLPVGALIGVLADADATEAELDAFITKFQEEQAPQAESDAAEGPSSAPHPVEVAGYTLNVREVGSGEGLPLLLVHGFGGDISNWLLTQDSLAKNRKVIAFDLPGHGASSKNVQDGSLAGLAKVATSLLDALGVSKAHVMGHSLGGGVALTVLRDAPEKVASLTLIAPATIGTHVNADFITGFTEAERNRAVQHELEKLVYNKALIGRKMVDAVVRARRLDGARDALRTIASACFDNDRQRDALLPVLEKTDIPVEVIWGQEDAILSADAAKTLPDKVEVHVLTESGHLPQMEKAADVNKLVEEFLEKSEK
ncbi:MAG: acetoin dehydrogenase dihydrolipoyllysine-residue acetyltransferase subunit [Acetobacter orientalis]|uniref:acetoin dehydrogenase dihydrolipoyllysine-residue acetyltransferase subunit n=1 Tax=Acetobacter orientalis TaxID=146474 RepID=UPI0039E85A60